MTLPLRIELAMTFKAVFPDILARDRSGHGRPEAIEAVSGCNILILPVDASAADLKFLHWLPQPPPRNYKSKSGTRNIELPVPLLLPKFVSGDATRVHELRKRGTGVLQTDGASR